MRPIDDLREKIDLWKKSTTDTALMSVLHDVLKQIDVAIYEMDHQEAESTWRKVEDGMPEIGKRVLVSCGGDVRILKHEDGRTYNGMYYWWNESDGIWERVENGSYWMPIEPPKEGQNDNNKM